MKSKSMFQPLEQGLVLRLVLLGALALQGCANGASSQAQAAELLPEGPTVGGTATVAEEDLFSDAASGAASGAASDVSTDTSSGANSQAGDVDAVLEAATDRVRYVNVNFSVLKRLLVLPSAQRTLRINLFDDAKINVVLSDTHVYSPENFAMTGHIAGDPDGAVTLVMKNGVLLANVRSSQDDSSYEVRYAGGVHVIRALNETANAQAACETVEATENEASHQPLVDLEAAANSASPLATPVIDMLVAYTPKAKAEQGGLDGITALIQMGIADTNAAFADSGVNLQVRLSGIMETTINESTNMTRDLNALRDRSDARFNEIHAERARLGADQVTLVGAYRNASTPAGIGFASVTATNAYTVVKTSYFGQYTFTHELGHNVGLAHGDGYTSSAGHFRTIMAYGSYPRIRRFSNPDLTYRGVPTGTQRYNSAAILNARASMMSGAL